jgi:hypothetical protein
MNKDKKMRTLQYLCKNAITVFKIAAGKRKDKPACEM